MELPCAADQKWRISAFWNTYRHDVLALGIWKFRIWCFRVVLFMRFQKSTTLWYRIQESSESMKQAVGKKKVRQSLSWNPIGEFAFPKNIFGEFLNSLTCQKKILWGDRCRPNLGCKVRAGFLLDRRTCYLQLPCSVCKYYAAWCWWDRVWQECACRPSANNAGTSAVFSAYRVTPVDTGVWCRRDSVNWWLLANWWQEASNRKHRISSADSQIHPPERHL